jgi:hypothetical protein
MELGFYGNVIRSRSKAGRQDRSTNPGLTECKESNVLMTIINMSEEDC